MIYNHKQPYPASCVRVCFVYTQNQFHTIWNKNPMCVEAKKGFRNMYGVTIDNMNIDTTKQRPRHSITDFRVDW